MSRYFHGAMPDPLEDDPAYRDWLEGCPSGRNTPNLVEKGSQSADMGQIGGDHYKRLGASPWAIMGENFTKEQFEGFLRGNVLKYILRYPDKNGIEDVRKARHYLDKLIEVLDSD